MECKKNNNKKTNIYKIYTCQCMDFILPLAQLLIYIFTYLLILSINVLLNFFQTFSMFKYLCIV